MKKGVGGQQLEQLNKILNILWDPNILLCIYSLQKLKLKLNNFNRLFFSLSLSILRQQKWLPFI